MPSETQITMKLKPREYDLIRDALQARRVDARSIANDVEASGPDRHEARELAQRIEDLIAKVG